jgi:integrase
MPCKRHGAACRGHATEPDYERPVLDLDELWRVIGAAIDGEERAAILLAYDLALRACEVQRVPGSAIDWRHGRVQARRAKSGKGVYVAVSPHTLAALRPLVHGPGPIFPDWSARRFRDHFREAVGRAGLSTAPARDGGVGFSHVLRRSKATHLLEAGGSLVEVQRHLGHKSLRTTLLYLGMTQRQRAEADLRAASTLTPPDART